MHRSRQSSVAASLVAKTLIYGEGDHRRQVIHVLEQEPRAKPRPAVVFFHGGGLTAGTPLQDMDWAEPMAEQGYVAFMAGYRLFDEKTGDNPWPTQLTDARRAMRWIRAHAGEFNIDSDRVCAFGHSSGGHLASLLGTTDPSDESDPELVGISSRANCVVTVSGDADLTVRYEDRATTRILNALLGGTIEQIPDVWRAASPAHNVDEQTAPFLIIHGNRDEGVPIKMSRNLAAALGEAGIEYVFAELPAGHMDVAALEATSVLWDAFLAYRLHPER